MLTNNHSISSTTNNLILDHLFYQSIQSRLQRAFSFEEEEKDQIKRRQQPKAETAENKNVIESVIEGILPSRHNKKLSRDNNTKLEQRLNLCQLTNLAIGRCSTTRHVTGSLINSNNNNNNNNCKRTINNRDYDKNEVLFSKPFSPLFCRRHRRPNCCPKELLLLQQQQQPGLAEAIPAFLKTSAYMLRSALEHHQGVAKPLMVAGQQVMGGGMPPRWYDLFLDLLTQAAIQSYMCDAKTGLETIYEIFSYGYVEDEEEDDVEEEEDDEDEEEDDDDDYDDEDNIWNVKAADHHLLFPKTRTMYLFKLQVREREKEFIQIKEGSTLEMHFKELEKLYPLIYFERNMCDFIQMVLEHMEIPALDKCDIISPVKSPVEDLLSPDELQQAIIPPLYKYASDGSLLMPEIPDIIDEAAVVTIPKKRSAYMAELPSLSNTTTTTNNNKHARH
ncbi:MAG: hypothetical protein EXX96DRAFT_580027 [Benjaminiella poitrasii]|nr:MAG: hypothetical protein EXX96DRAFT_580027 [Benjaminiella poitrasii]